MQRLEEILVALAAAVAAAPGFAELRFVRRRLSTYLVRDGTVAVAECSDVAGVHVAVVHRGVRGRAVAERIEALSLRKAIDRAHDNARAAAGRVEGGVRSVPERPCASLAQGIYEHPGVRELAALPSAARVGAILSLAADARRQSTRLATVIARYRELIEEVAVVSSDGARAAQRLARPDAVLMLMASDAGATATLSSGAGVAGGWTALWEHPDVAALAETAVPRCVDLLRAPSPASGRSVVVLAPSLAGLLCHEAVGHVLERDCVHEASIAYGGRGARIGSERVTVIDAGVVDDDRAAGTLQFDDEGVLSRPVDLVTEGRIAGYLHDSASAAFDGDALTGNARSWACTDVPLVRMRNTYLRPGDATVDELVGGLRSGYVFAGSGSGQAEANGTIVLTAPYGWRVERGRRVELVRGTALVGYAADVLTSVDAVASDLAWAMGIDFCEKGGQRARVDAGGPHVRCTMEVRA